MNLHIEEEGFELFERGIDLIELFLVVVADHAAVDTPFKIFAAHSNQSVEQVPQIIAEVGIDTVDQGLLAEVAISTEGNFPEHKVAEIIQTIGIGHLFGVDDITLGFAHLGTVSRPPPMRGDMLGHRQIETHQKCRPVDRMKAEDILADQMDACRPEIHQFFVCTISQSCDIVHQGIKPDIHHMFGIIEFRWKFHAPVEAGSGDGEIIQASFDETDHFIALTLWQDAVRPFIVPVEQFVLIVGESEEVALLFYQ